MASSLVNFAVASVKPPHASYYGPIDDSNPVVSAANKELKEIMAYFSKKSIWNCCHWRSLLKRVRFLLVSFTAELQMHTAYWCSVA